jgi:hypothetical protein
MKTIKITLGIFLLLLSAISFAQTAEEIVKKHIEAIGGKDNWSKIKSMKMEGVTKAQGAEVHVTSYQQDKKAKKDEISLMGMTGYSIITNTEGWVFMPFQGQTKPEPMTADDVKNQQDELYIQDDFMTYTELGKKLEYIGKDDVDGTECYKLKMTDKGGKETTFYIDPVSNYTIKKTSKVKANGQEFEIHTVYSNYKKFDEGIVYAMNIASNSFGEMEITKLELNPAFDESVFKLPKENTH